MAVEINNPPVSDEEIKFLAKILAPIILSEGVKDDDKRDNNSSAVG